MRKSRSKLTRKSKLRRKSHGGRERLDVNGLDRENMDEFRRLVENIRVQETPEQRIAGLKRLFEFILTNPVTLIEPKIRNSLKTQIDIFLQDPLVQEDDTFKNLTYQMKMLIAEYEPNKNEEQ